MRTIDVQQRVADIERGYAADGDDEKAQCLEDELYKDVLQAIADGAPNGWLLARQALRTQQLTFARW